MVGHTAQVLEDMVLPYIAINNPMVLAMARATFRIVLLILRIRQHHILDILPRHRISNHTAEAPVDIGNPAEHINGLLFGTRCNYPNG